MKKIAGRLRSGRLLTVAALFGIALIALVAVPFVASADEPANRGQRNQPTSVSQCLERVAREDPLRDEFLDELVNDAVISAEQAAEIDARLDEKHLGVCIGRVLYRPGNAVTATAEATGTEKREVLGAIVAGESLSEYANSRGVDDAALVDAIMAAPEAKAAELVAAGEVTQTEVDAVLARIESRVTEMIQKTDISPRRMGAEEGQPVG